MKLAILGGSIGYITACIIIFFIKLFSKNINDGIIGNFQSYPYIYLYILIIPIIAGIIAKVSAILTIKKELEKMV
jgi:cell division protein FtsX